MHANIIMITKYIFTFFRFVENFSYADLELSKPWRLKILQALKDRIPESSSEFALYERAIETYV